MDLSFATRYLLRRPGLALTAIAMMSIGIGATTAMFSVVHGVLWRPLAYAEPGRLVSIWETFPHWRGRPVLDAQWDRIALSFSEYRAVASMTDRFETVAAAYWRRPVRLRGEGDTVEISVARGSVSLMPLLGVRPAVGRWFLPGEEGPGAPQIAVLSHAIWATRFGRDAGVLGRTITLNERPFTIVGVLPESFVLDSLSPFATPGEQASVWTPPGAWPGDLVENSQNYEVLARLRPGVTADAVREEVARMIRGTRSAALRDARVVTRLDAETFGARLPLLALFAAVAALLVVACGNLSALLLGDAVERQGEIRTRVSLGATRLRLARQMISESLVLAVAGATLGCPLSLWLTAALVAGAPFELPRRAALAPDWESFAAAALFAAAAAMVCGLAPALVTARADGSRPTGQRSIARTRGRIQRVLIATQIAVALVLAISVGLLLRTLQVERSLPLGFDGAGLLTVEVSSAPQSFYDALVERARALPGVVDVASTSNTPVSGRGGQWSVSPDPTRTLSSSSPTAQHDEVLANFFGFLAIPILAGRGLEGSDVRGTRLVAVVNESMARQLWPGESALGKMFVAPNGGVRTVVGVSADILESGPGRPAVPTFYESVAQVQASRQTLLIRVVGDPRALAASMRRIASEIDRGQPAPRIDTMDGIVERALAPQRYRVLLGGFFALCALAMTLVGTFGVAARTVAAERRELCVRLALGASGRQVVALVVGRYLSVAAAGVAAGLAVAALSTRVLRGYLFGVAPIDPLTFACAAMAVTVLVAGAAWLPARALQRLRLAEHLAG